MLKGLFRKKSVRLSELENFTRRYMIMLNMGSPILSCLAAPALETKNKYFSQTFPDEARIDLTAKTRKMKSSRIATD